MHDAQPRRSRFVHGFAVLVLVLGTGAFFVIYGPGSTGESSPAVLAVWILAYAVATVVLLDGLLRDRRSIYLPPELAIFIGIVVASTFWSEVPALTARRSLGLVGTVLIALLLAQRLRPLELLNALRQAMLIIALISLGLYAAGAGAVVDDTHGTLRGVVATKNTLGFVMALGLLACAVCYLLVPVNRRRHVLSAAPMIITLALTDSKSSVVITACVAAGTAITLLLRRRRGPLALVASGCLLLAGAVSVLPSVTLEGVAEVLGEDTTLTGRDAVWEESLAAAEAHPFVGYGYGAFWDGTDAAARIQARLLWPVPTAHNGVLEVLLDVGVLGVLGALAVVVALFVRGLRDARLRRRRAGTLRLSMAVLLFTSNIVESNFLVQNNILTLLVVAALAMRHGEEQDADAAGPGTAVRDVLDAGSSVGQQPHLPRAPSHAPRALISVG